MKVLIIGGRRYLGPRLVARLLEQGHEPVLFNRGRTKAPLPTKQAVREVHGDCRDPAALTSLLRQESFDAVVDTQSFSSSDAQLSAEVFNGKVGKYLVISSVACYGRLKNVPADENHPYVSGHNAFPGEANGYATGKRDVEGIFRAAHDQRGFPIIIIRPSVSYGYARLTSIWGYCTRHVSRIRAGKPIIVPDTGEGLIQPVHIDDEAVIVEKALSCDQAIGQAFNCAGPVAVPLWEYFRAHGEAMGKDVQFVEVSTALIRGFDPVRGARAAENLIFNHAYDVAKLQRVLGFTHYYSLVAGLKQTIEFLDRWNLIAPSQDTDLEDRLIELSAKVAVGQLTELGADLRKKMGYEPPKNSPLVNWAPDAYSLA